MINIIAANQSGAAPATVAVLTIKTEARYQPQAALTMMRRASSGANLFFAYLLYPPSFAFIFERIEETPVNTTRLSLATIATALTLTPTISHAENNPRLEQMVVTASRIAMPLREVGASMTVLNRADIDARGQSTVAELLRTLPSIGVSNSGGLGKATTLRVRGEEGFRTKVLVDGIEFADVSGTQVQPQIQHLLTANIERIEVLRGPQGMMYGADAGGVINIITQKANQPLQGNIGFEYGSHESQQLVGNVRGQVNNFDYSLSLSDLSSDGFNARKTDTSADDDGYENTTVGLTTGLDITEKVRIQLILRDVDADSEFDNCSGSNNCNGEFAQTDYKIDLLVDNGAFNHQLSLAKSKTERKNLADNTTVTFEIEGEQDQIQYQGSFSPSEAMSFVYGIDLETEQVTSAGQDTERDQKGAYLELQSAINSQFFYTIGARHDDNDDFGNHTSYRLTTAYIIPVAGGNEIKLKSSFGSGFRAPSISELAYNRNFSFPPASFVTLEEETSEGYDLGIEYHASNGLFVELVYFDQEIDNEIEFDLIDFSGYLQQSGTTESTGAELSVELPITAGLIINGNYTYNDTEGSDGLQRSRRPRNTANIGASYTGLDDKLKVTFNARFVKDSVNDIFGIGQVELDDYHVVDANIAYTLQPALELYVRGENIFDQEYEEITGFNSGGASIYTGFRYQF